MVNPHKFECLCQRRSGGEQDHECSVEARRRRDEAPYVDKSLVFDETRLAPTLDSQGGDRRSLSSIRSRTYPGLRPFPRHISTTTTSWRLLKRVATASMQFSTWVSHNLFACASLSVILDKFTRQPYCRAFEVKEVGRSVVPTGCERSGIRSTLKNRTCSSLFPTETHVLEHRACWTQMGSPTLTDVHRPTSATRARNT